MKAPLFLAAMMLAGCVSSVQMVQQAPFSVVHSDKSRSAVADCLLDRVSSDGLRPERTEDAGVTTIGFTSADALIRPRPAIYLFTVRDADTGSTIEVRRLGKAPLATAETCF